MRTFIILLVTLIVLILIIITLSAVGIVYLAMKSEPNLPRAQPWWRRSQMYQINIATWANDVGGPVGRLQDIIPRMAYLSKKVISI